MTLLRVMQLLPRNLPDGYQFIRKTYWDDRMKKLIIADNCLRCCLHYYRANQEILPVAL
ncbi:MAG: hypothetical protein VKL59_04570 [Nostocaceae cyanobacterium]|nr:hypothetical protein [Nostocaceae cyanobacterium]